MKLPFLSFITFLFIVESHCFAGTSHFGVLAGVNLANMSSQPDEAFKSRMAPVFGGYYEYKVSHLLGLSPEFLVVGKGGQRSADDLVYRLSYFELPLLMKFHFTAKRFGFMLFGGPSVGFVVSSSAVTAANEELSISSLYPNEMGVQVGGGVEFPLSNTLGFLLNVRYTTGLSDISQTASNYKNKGIYIVAGLSFRSEDEDSSTDTESRAKEYLNKKFGAPEAEPPPLVEPTHIE